MAGAIDPHTHIGGGKMTIARKQDRLPEDHMKDEAGAHRASPAPAPATAVPSTMVTGYRYAEMGYTACFEPAMLRRRCAPAPHHGDGRDAYGRQRRFRHARQLFIFSCVSSWQRTSSAHRRITSPDHALAQPIG